jgi:deoxyribodipyrimidine photolyase-related protein
MKTLRLILGDQLNANHFWFSKVDANVSYVFMEMRQETDYVLHHAQKILGIFAAMRHFAEELQAKGHQVIYLKIEDPKNLQGLTKNIDRLIAEHSFNAFEYQEPDEWRLDDQLNTYCQSLSIPSKMFSSEHFLADREDVGKLFAGRKKWLMETFYRQMRVKYEVLIEKTGSSVKPIGGQWNFDQENRKAWKGNPIEPNDARPFHDHRKLWQTIERCGVKSFGNPQAENFRWPVSRTEALSHLKIFIDQILPHFGDYQDAMSMHSWRMFHSLISFGLNIKLLHPLEVIRAAEAAYLSNKVSLSAAEGFIRQILGWREYIRGVYWANMPEYVNHNYFGHETPLPDWFWTGNTKMNCVSHAIKQSLEHAYAHHIQRLMITGNFALLAGINPQALHEWYLGIYIDAFEWVELPNTLGMSQFGDGGLLATKPYVSSAAYIDRMSDYCKTCVYDKKKRLELDACPFNALYWDFYQKHEDKLSKNPRIGMAYRQLAKMSAEELKAIKEKAGAIRENLNEL